MIIILEGIDRVGKTTLANKLSEKFNIPILRQERIGGNDRNSEESMLMNYGRTLGLIHYWNWDGFSDNIILDRFHWTEAVYSMVDRKNPKPMNCLSYIEKYMLEKIDKYLIIQVMPVNIKDSSRQHGSDLTKHQELFDALYKDCKLNKYRCTYFSYDLCMDEVERRLISNGETK